MGKMTVLGAFFQKVAAQAIAICRVILLIILSGYAFNIQGQSGAQPQVVRVTGARFVYPLLQNWIDRFSKEHPEIQVIIESRGSTDPSQYDVLLEAFEHTDEVRHQREYVYIARYAVLPIANSRSQFASIYRVRGLNKELISGIFFHDLFSDKSELDVKAPFTVYTRLQKAGVPIIFSSYYGYEQKDIRGKSIAGADEHLIKALLRDTTGISYAPLSLIYSSTSGKFQEGIDVLPVDLNGNGKVNDEEKFYQDLPSVIARIEKGTPSNLRNIPVAYLHLSVDKKTVSPEAITFISWLINHGGNDLHSFGYLHPEPGRLDKDKFEQFSIKRVKQ